MSSVDTYRSSVFPVNVFLAFAFLFPPILLAKDAVPTSVFDLVLGQPFTIRECSYEIVEREMGMEGVAVPKRNRGLFGKPDHVSKMYRYTEIKPATDKCFQRVGPFYTSPPIPGVALPPALPPNNQKVKLIYADDARPALADSEDIWIGIQDTRLTGIRFYFQNRNERNVLQVLIKKYGRPDSTEKFVLQTPEGTLRNYSNTNWNFPRLRVTFLSLETKQIGYDPQDSPIGYRSEVGSVTVQYLEQETIRGDGNPL